MVRRERVCGRKIKRYGLWRRENLKGVFVRKEGLWKNKGLKGSNNTEKDIKRGHVWGKRYMRK
jgi:hypothetical protein